MNESRKDGWVIAISNSRTKDIVYRCVLGKKKNALTKVAQIKEKLSKSQSGGAHYEVEIIYPYTEYEETRPLAFPIVGLESPATPSPAANNTSDEGANAAKSTLDSP